MCFDRKNMKIAFFFVLILGGRIIKCDFKMIWKLKNEKYEFFPAWVGISFHLIDLNKSMEIWKY